MFGWLSRRILEALGWRFEGGVPDYPKCVIVGAPHTSNWDFVLMVAFSQMMGMRVSWLGKHTVFRWPLGVLFRALGGIPINRTIRQRAVDQVVEAFRKRERLMLIITPEGTRKKTPTWKTGFYHIAVGAKVPIVLAFNDYRRKVVGIGPTLLPSGDLDADFEKIRIFYSDKTARHPEKVGEVRGKKE